MGLSYVIGIPLGYGLIGMWVGFALDENVRGIILLRRWRSGKWRNKGFVKDGVIPVPNTGKRVTRKAVDLYKAAPVWKNFNVKAISEK